jgi:hypothetical protein
MSDAPLDYLTLGQAFGTLSRSKCQRHQTGEGAITSKAEVEGRRRVRQFRFVLTTLRALIAALTAKARRTAPSQRGSTNKLPEGTPSDLHPALGRDNWEQPRTAPARGILYRDPGCLAHIPF